MIPAEHRGEVDREGDHEPDIPGAEQEQPRRGQPVDRGALGEDLGEFGFGLRLAQVPLQQDQAQQPDRQQSESHGTHGTGEAQQGEQGAAEKESGPLQGVLGPGEQGHPAKQCALGALGYQQLDCALGAHLVQVLGDSRQGLGRHDPGHSQTGFRDQQHRQGHDLQPQPYMHGAVEAQPRAQPTAQQVGHHAEHLVKQEHQGDLQGAVSQGVEMQHHQHAQGAVGEGERPVVAGDDEVLADRGRQTIEAGHVSWPAVRPPSAAIRRCGWRNPTRCRTRRTA